MDIDLQVAQAVKHKPRGPYLMIIAKCMSVLALAIFMLWKSHGLGGLALWQGALISVQFSSTPMFHHLQVYHVRLIICTSLLPTSCVMRRRCLAQPWRATVATARSASITGSQGLSSWTLWRAPVVIRLDVSFRSMHCLLKSLKIIKNRF